MIPSLTPINAINKSAMSLDYSSSYVNKILLPGGGRKYSGKPRFPLINYRLFERDASVIQIFDILRSHHRFQCIRHTFKRFDLAKE